ncbi:hypothetical protein DFR29_1237 [Tahibacter aquaticus]|uniref:Peptidase C-terminal archaeal/bacterial domain-containing protein n=1 Tax=Tahibacter aquaticus TaxID=520092 RepID=A0A4R6YL90_9GAMM|nr:hypothetical protein [Tahibacter aquaticus]TDR37833.1 hypothetical protein DFR29_1237 [Tahibacter aquaticus]
MIVKNLALAATLVLLPGAAALAQNPVNLDGYKAQYPTATPAVRSALDQALAAQYSAISSTWPVPNGPVEGDVCTPASPAPVNPFTISSTTLGATNNYDIATTCGVGQTLFAGTGASLDVAYGVVTDQNCSVTVSADPTGTNWDLALYVLAAPGAACTALPTLADPQCITMDDDGASNTTETVTFNAVAGTQYFVIIDGFNAATGTFDLNITGTGCNLVPVSLQSFSVD